ncbi:MAG: hypothetical protein RLZZ383_909, partial [Pseudomonadota bacterium]
MASAGVAMAASPESAWFNPAALPDDGGLRIAAGATVAASRVTAAASDGTWTARTNTPLGTPPWLYASYGRDRWAISATGNVAYGGGVTWPDDAPVRYAALASRPMFARATLAFAWNFGPVSLALGPHLDAGGLRVEKATDHVADEGRVTLAARGWGVGGDVALHGRIGQRAALGLTYRSRTSLKLQGEADFDLPPAFAAERNDDTLTAQWTLPDRVAAGFAWTEDRWRVATEVDLTVWSVNQTLTFDLASEPDLSVVNGWRETVAVRVGAAAALGRVELRAGAFADLAGAPPPERLGPASPDGPRVGASLGLGVDATQAVAIDLYASPMAILRRASTSPDLPDASYGGFAVLAGLGLQVQVP